MVVGDATCAECGAKTVWDSCLPGLPVCVRCWDKKAEADSEVLYSWLLSRRELYEANQEKRRIYCEANREKIAAYQHRYYETHRAEKEARDRKYQEKNREAIAEYCRDYRKANREKLSAYSRERRMFIDFGVCRACGLPIHFNKTDGWTHYRRDRSHHSAEYK